MKNIILLITCLFLICSDLFSQEKVELKLIVQNQSSRIPKSLLRTQAKYSGEQDALAKLELRIQKLRRKGFLEANIDSICLNAYNLNAYIHLGNNYKLGKLSHEGLDINQTSEVSFRFANRTINNLSELESTHKKIINVYNDNGYPFARVKPDTIRIRSNEIIGAWKLHQGNYTIWDSINLKGNIKVRKQFLIKYLDIKPGEPYSENTYNTISTKISNLNFCNEIKPAEIEFIKNKAVVYTYLDKEASNRFDGIIGLQSDKDSNDDLSITGEINLLLNNAFRSGEQLGLNWKKFDSESQDLSIGFMHPYIISKIGVDFKFKLSKQDSTYLTTKLNTSLRLFQKGSRHIKLFYQYQASSLISTSHLAGVSVLPDYADVKTNLAGLGFVHSKLDYPFNPKRGWFVDFTFGAGTHRIKKNRKIPEELYNGLDLNGTILNAEWKGELNLPLSNRISYRIKNAGGFKASDNLFINDLFKIGGLNTLRGFDEDIFRVSKYSVLTNELRFIPERNTSFYLFTDAAYYKQELLDQSFDDFPVGVGFGLSFGTKAGIFNLNYALGKQKNQNFDFRSAKIHFGFVSRF